MFWATISRTCRGDTQNKTLSPMNETDAALVLPATYANITTGMVTIISTPNSNGEPTLCAHSSYTVAARVTSFKSSCTRLFSQPLLRIYPALSRRTLIPLLLCSVPSVSTPAQRRISPRQAKTTGTSPAASGLRADANTLTGEEREYCSKILKALDGSDAIFVSGQDPSGFRESLDRVKGMIDDVDEELHEGQIRAALVRMTRTYFDLGVLATLAAKRHKDGRVEIGSKKAEDLGEMRRRYDRLLGDGLITDLLNPDNMAKIYEHGLKMKEELHEALK